MKKKFKVQTAKFKIEHSERKANPTGSHHIREKSFAADSKSKVQNSEYKSQNQSIIFGLQPILEALRAENRRVEKIFVADGAHEQRLAEILFLAKQNRIPFQKTARENLSKQIEPGANHQGVIAYVAAADYYPAEKLLDEIYRKIEAGKKTLIVILDGVEDPRNLGAILRTIECAGADGVFIPERRAAGLTETVAKSSAGATEYVKVAKIVNVNRLIDELKEHNIWVIGTSGDARMNYTDWDFNQSCALILGGEGKGLHRLTAEKCDALVKIPMRGRIESLNVSVACGVILFETVRQRIENLESKKIFGD